MATPRILPGGLKELGLVNWLLCRAISRVAGTPDAHLFSTLGRQRGLFRAWLRFAARMMPGGTLSRHESELVILRVAHLRGCTYELDHHLRLGRRVGIDAELAERIFAGPATPGWSDRHRALLAAADALVATRDLGDAEWAALSIHYTEPQRIELCMLVGHYELLATTITALRIARDF
jgi:AhpD family alkylhydroperoxidase